MNDTPPAATSATLQPGDLDKMRFAFLSSPRIDTASLSDAAGFDHEHGERILAELLSLGEATRAVGHDHGDGDLCQCTMGAPASSALVHWYLDAEDAVYEARLAAFEGASS